jgi:hypothetical protein
MDHPTLDERLPALYREILASVTELERLGRRAEGLRARRRAAREYMTWDERAERRLVALLEDVHRRLRAPSTREELPARLRSRLRRSVRPGSGSAVQPSA